MGASYRTARRAVDELEEQRLIKFLGMRQIHPGTADSTQIFEILIKPLETDEHQYPHGLPVASQATPNRPNGLPVAREADNLYSSVERVGSSPEGKLSGAAIPGTVLYRDDDDKSKTTDKTEKSNPVQGQRFSNEEIKDLVTLWGHIGLAPDDEAEATLRSTSSRFPAAHLAVLMMYAFKLSNWWNKPENWKTGCDMSSFVHASGTINDQFGGWRNGVRDKFLEKFPTVKSVCDHLVPPDDGEEGSGDGSLLSPEEVCEDGQHVWEDYSHVVQQCSVCGKFRTNPIVTRWTAADDLEAEYMELLDCYPCVYDPVLNEWK
jgi:hypothetical protein